MDKKMNIELDQKEALLSIGASVSFPSELDARAKEVTVEQAIYELGTKPKKSEGYSLFIKTDKGDVFLLKHVEPKNQEFQVTKLALIGLSQLGATFYLRAAKWGTPE